MAHGERLRYIGTLVRTHGINGALVLHCDSHRDAVQLRPGMTLQIGYSARFALPYTLRRFRSTPRGIILELEQVHTLAQARQLLEQGVFVAEDLVAPAQRKRPPSTLSTRCSAARSSPTRVPTWARSWTYGCFPQTTSG